ncbi:MAG TPA: DedA family protein [Nevskiaceae bacterium]|nr:DedA family protein [Nevskiaceae bacterium]
MTEALAHVQVWIEQFYGSLTYTRIFLLMALESSLFPVPAELVLVPAGYMAQAGRFSFSAVVAAAALGSLLGASVNYLIGRTLGRAFLQRYGRYLLVDPPRYAQAERLFLRNASLATFIGRLLPVIRHLISLPAGVFSMNKPAFALWTVAGSAILCAFETAIGYFVGPPAVALMTRYSHFVGIAVVVLLVLAALGWLVRAKWVR